MNNEKNLLYTAPYPGKWDFVCVSKGFKIYNQVSEKPQTDSLSSVEQQEVLSSNYSGCSHL